jgi:tetratricopeptide (TPR) repeat protein
VQALRKRTETACGCPPAAPAARTQAEAHFARGLGLHDAGQLDPAMHAFAAALALTPTHVESIVALGHCLLDAERHADAADLINAALHRHPEDVSVLILQGRALSALGNPAQAIGALSLALAVEPANAAAHTGLAAALAASGDMDGALHHSLTAFRLVSDHAHASNFSSLLVALGHFKEAQVVAEYALRLRPNYFGALVNWASALDALGRLEDAVIAGQRAVASAPDNVTGRLLLGGLHLRLGQMSGPAWDLYEWRLRLAKSPPAWMGAPRWSGEALAGQTVLLHAEQGLGDTLQFVRYAPLVAARAGRVILVVQRPLLRLLQNTPGVDEIVALGDELPPFDVLCPLLSLPRLFGTTLESIPPALPYPSPSSPVAAHSEGPLRVGLVWAGNPDFPLDRQRSLPVAALAALAGIPGVQFHSLQYLASPVVPAALPAALGATDLMAGVMDFADTAARIAGLDLVIAVDTAVAHLAATMGKPVWLLSRFRGCWRWLHDRADSPWYPSMRIIRQARLNDWTGVMEQVRRDLSNLTVDGRTNA